MSSKYIPTQEEIDRFPKRKNVRFEHQNNAWIVRKMVKGKLYVKYFTLLRNENSMELAYQRACEHIEAIEKGGALPE